jgi:hypothetical protein
MYRKAVEVQAKKKKSLAFAAAVVLQSIPT